MGIKIEKCLTCGNNPSGITINYGYYALLECILARTNPKFALLRWCGLWFEDKPHKKQKKRAYVPRDPKVHDKVVEIYRANPTLQNTEIARMVGRSKTFVSKTLLGIGVKRSRWENYKKEDKNEETV